MSGPGTASLAVERGRHPRREIDGVTAPRGCTIAALGEMEHRGVGSTPIKGIASAVRRAGGLHEPEVRD